MGQSDTCPQITITFNCTAHVDDPASAGSVANGSSPAGASTYATGIGNMYITTIMPVQHMSMIQPVLGHSQMAHHRLVHLHMQRNRYRQYVHYNNNVCIAYVDDPESAGSFANGPSLIGACTHAVGTGNEYITVTHDCTAYVDDPDSAGSFANGPSLAGASTHVVGTGNKYIFIFYTHPQF